MSTPADYQCCRWSDCPTCEPQPPPAETKPPQYQPQQIETLKAELESLRAIAKAATALHSRFGFGIELVIGKPALLDALAAHTAKGYKLE